MALDHVEHLGEQRFGVLAQIADDVRGQPGHPDEQQHEVRGHGLPVTLTAVRQLVLQRLDAGGPLGTERFGHLEPQRTRRAAVDEREQQRVRAPRQVRAGSVRAERVGREEHAPPVGPHQVLGLRLAHDVTRRDHEQVACLDLPHLLPGPDDAAVRAEVGEAGEVVRVRLVRTAADVVVPEAHDGHGQFAG